MFLFNTTECLFVTIAWRKYFTWNQRTNQHNFSFVLFYRIKLSFVLFYRITPSFILFYRIKPCFMLFYCIKPSCILFYPVKHSFISFYWIQPEDFEELCSRQTWWECRCRRTGRTPSPRTKPTSRPPRSGTNQSQLEFRFLQWI